MRILVYVFIVGLLAFWTLQRNEVFRSEVSLWEDNFLKSPNKPRVCVNLAYAYKRVGENEKGIAALTRAMEIHPELIPYFAAVRYAGEQGGRLLTEIDVWSPIRR